MEAFHRRVTVLAILADRPHDRHAKAPRHVRPKRIEGLGLLEPVLVHQFGQIIGLKRPTPGDHLVRYQAQRVLVGPAVEILSPLTLLRGHVLRRAQQVAGRGERRLGCQSLGYAKVGKNDAVPLLIEHHVVGLDVPVDNAAPVGVRQGVGGLTQIALDLRQRRLGVVVEQHPQATPADIRHGEEGEATFAVYLVHLDDRGVIQLALRAGLPQKTLDQLGVIGEERQQDFDRDLPLERLLVAEEDDRHPAAAQLSRDVVPALGRFREALVDLAHLRR
jgi:hypothetical protein